MIRDRQEVKDIFYQCPKCGKTLQGPNGTFGTFDTQIYPNSPLIETEESCEWRISGAHGERIALNIEALNIYETTNCTTDYLEIRDGYWNGSPLLGRFCGNEIMTQPLITLSNRMLVTYVRTSGNKNDYGFMASYYKVCGGDIEINQTRIYLESPNYPYDYDQNIQCTWRFFSPKDQRMRGRSPLSENKVVLYLEICIRKHVCILLSDKKNDPWFLSSVNKLAIHN
ncbi:dorsal-ventral patterning tolloid-like protein 1 [Microplitis mediator]|uniref:dorsal-ventral patterning tolloid-like protein 1 n=1 Tax=Microplitis mediator TaxID=375433 RepID=UPI002552AA9C|nr:dorsal-ventral patterning tolloid-like protein 1 [Microplitis mediator]